jgi:hypothetical protein
MSTPHEAIIDAREEILTILLRMYSRWTAAKGAVDQDDLDNLEIRIEQAKVDLGVAELMAKGEASVRLL